MPANDSQIGGDHYKAEYQYWDFAHDVRLPYVPATAGKYIARWRKKDGSVDLQKALHYLEKTIELNIAYVPSPKYYEHFWKFVLGSELHIQDAAALFFVLAGEWGLAAQALADLAKAGLG
jgi:hypothetical protein